MPSNTKVPPKEKLLPNPFCCNYLVIIKYNLCETRKPLEKISFKSKDKLCSSYSMEEICYCESHSKSMDTEDIL